MLIFLLTTFSGVEQHIAQGANLIFFIPTSIAAIIVHLKKKNIQLKTTMVIILSGVVGAIIGAKLAVNMEVGKLRKYFGFFLIAIAINEIYSLTKEYIKNKKANNKNI